MNHAPQIARIKQKILDEMEAVLDQMQRRHAPPEAQEKRDRTALLRRLADTLGLAQMCGLPACRRARKCRRRPQACIARHAWLVPPDVRAGVVAMLRGRGEPP